MKYTVLFFFLVVSISANAQARDKGTDTEIVNAILGKNVATLNSSLDALGIWYYYHTDDDKAAKEPSKRVYSMQTGSGAVKVYSIFVNDKKLIDEIIINFRHDNREHIEDYQAIGKAGDHHVGVHSTDVTFKWK
jgi:hypothetical protein